MPWKWKLDPGPPLVRTGVFRDGGDIKLRVHAERLEDNDPKGTIWPVLRVRVTDRDGVKLGRILMDADDSRALAKPLPRPLRRKTVQLARVDHSWDGGGTPGPNDRPLQPAIEAYALSIQP